MDGPHPEMLAILREQEAAALPALDAMPLTAARAQFFAVNAGWNQDLPPLPAEDVTLGGVACRLLGAAGDAAGAIVFVHGGGWTFGAPASHERFARLLAAGCGMPVIVPDYRLAPEHPAPAAIDDVLAVLADLGRVVPAAHPVALCGDSAGANISLAAALDGPARPVAFLSLLYGCFAPQFETDSHARNGDGRYGLTSARMRWYWNNWLGLAADPRAIPLGRDLSHLPACHVLAAGLDPLLDDSLALTRELARLGVPVRLDVVPGVVHGFLQMTSRLAPARQATATVAAALRTALAPHD